MKIIRTVAVLRESGSSLESFKFVLLCGINQTKEMIDGEWVGYIQNESISYPFILKNRNSCFYGGNGDYFESINLGVGAVEVGRLFTMFSPEDEEEPWELTYEIINCHDY